jgi:hypothetical protein
MLRSCQWSRNDRGSVGASGGTIATDVPGAIWRDSGTATAAPVRRGSLAGVAETIGWSDDGLVRGSKVDSIRILRSLKVCARTHVYC